MKKPKNNPLLENRHLPAFDRIRPEHIEPAIEYLIADNRKQIEELVKDRNNINWENTIQRLEELDDRLNRAWSPASHLHSVADNEEIRKAYNNCIEKLSEYSSDLGQNEDLFHAYKTVAESGEFESLSTAQKKIIENALRDFRLSGIELDKKSRQTFKSLQMKLSKLQTRFEENLLDATHAWKKHIKDRSLLDGLPDSAIALAAQTAKREGVDGWVLTLEFPSYLPVMQHANNRDLRREMYTAYVTRASDQSTNKDWDNSEIMHDILAAR
ncbi:MAG: oligopeptidase A, partial [Gammaproteobacteria bacterium]